MVHNPSGRFEGLVPCAARSRPYRHYAKAPVQGRLQKWLARVFAASQFMRQLKTVTRLKLPQKLAQELGLPDSSVTLDCAGILRHESRAEALAAVS